MYRQVKFNLFPTYVDFFTGDPEKPIDRHYFEEPNGRFTVTLPYLPEATTLIFLSSPPGPEGIYEPAQEAARFDLPANVEDQ